MLALVGLLLVAAGLPGDCADGALMPPVDGPMVRPFAPDGTYRGHWGIDLATPPGSPVRAAAAGAVTFSGSVAGMQSVTVHHGGGLRTSYSYLSDRRVRAGMEVARGSTLGISGLHHGKNAMHFSLRLGDRYLDPVPLMGCIPSLAGALELLPAFGRFFPSANEGHLPLWERARGMPQGSRSSSLQRTD